MTSIKLGLLFLRTLAKPVATQLKTQAAAHPLFKEICIKIAQLTHRVEIKQKVRVGDKLVPGETRPLNEAKAVEAGANFLGEAILFSVAAGGLLFENWRSRRFNNQKTAEFDANVKNVADLDGKLSSIDSTLAELNKIVAKLQAENKDILHKISTLDGTKEKSVLDWFKSTKTVDKLPDVKAESKLQQESKVKNGPKHAPGIKELLDKPTVAKPLDEKPHGDEKPPLHEKPPADEKPSADEKKVSKSPKPQSPQPHSETIAQPVAQLSESEIARLDYGLLALADLNNANWATINALLSYQEPTILSKSWKELEMESVRLGQDADVLTELVRI
jgi:hypothetical protein